LVTLCHSDGRPFLALTVVWKLSYAMEDGHLPIQREKCGLSVSCKRRSAWLFQE